MIYDYLWIVCVKCDLFVQDCVCEHGAGPGGGESGSWEGAREPEAEVQRRVPGGHRATVRQQVEERWGPSENSSMLPFEHINCNVK